MRACSGSMAILRIVNEHNTLRNETGEIKEKWPQKRL
jgi:hypothetical protein